MKTHLESTPYRQAHYHGVAAEPICRDKADPVKQPLVKIGPNHPAYPTRLGSEGPLLYARGNLSLLGKRQIGVFSSVRATGSAILKAIVWARSMSGTDFAVISGFHSPLEQECLPILIRNHVPVIVCAAREIRAYRVPPTWGKAIDVGMLLLLSSTARSRRMTRKLSLGRNELVAALADEVVVMHAVVGSDTERLARELELRGKLVRYP